MNCVVAIASWLVRGLVLAWCGLAAYSTLRWVIEQIGWWAS